jgi:hypothetical protein
LEKVFLTSEIFSELIRLKVKDCVSSMNIAGFFLAKITDFMAWLWTLVVHGAAHVFLKHVFPESSVGYTA